MKRSQGCQRTAGDTGRSSHSLIKIWRLTRLLNLTCAALTCAARRLAAKRYASKAGWVWGR